MTTPLWQHQIAAIEKAKNRYALFFDPGCGKTRTTIELVKKAYPFTGSGASDIGVGLNGCAVLIFAPLNVCRNWRNELTEYLDRPHSVTVVAGQTKAKKIKLIAEFMETASDVTKPKFLIANIETLRSLEYKKLLAKCGAKFVVVDESHNFKGANSLQTKGLLEVVQAMKPDYLYLLTGTPAPQGEMDLWSTFKLLGITDDNFFIWRKKHFNDKNERRRGTANYWPDYVIRESSRELFKEYLSEYSSVARKDEVLDLPPILRTNIYAEMSVAQARHYENMVEFLFAIDEDGNELNAANLLTRTLRLQQILAGHLGNVAITDNGRLDALDEAIKLVGEEQFLVWTIFKSTYSEIAERIDAAGLSYGLLTGEQSAEERYQAMEDFQSGKLRALIAHPKAGGVGVNLTKASYSIHYTRNFSLVDDLQAEARNYRGGSEIHKRITRIDIVTADTIDEQISEALRHKKSVQDFILDLKEKHGKR